MSRANLVTSTSRVISSLDRGLNNLDRRVAEIECISQCKLRNFYSSESYVLVISLPVRLAVDSLYPNLRITIPTSESPPVETAALATCPPKLSALAYLHRLSD